MRAISAADAVSLAIQRTREFLFRNFRWGTYLKLGLVAILTEGLGNNFHSSNTHGGANPGHGPMLQSLADIPPLWIASIVFGVLFVVLVAFFIAYLITRLRFAFFHSLACNTTEIRPGWDLYREEAGRFFWLNVGIGFAFLCVIGLIAIPFVKGFIGLFHSIPPGGHPDWGKLIALILPLVPIILLIALIAVLLDIVLRDWVLPHYALEDASPSEAFAQVWAHFLAEKRQFISYILLRIVLPTIAVVALFILLIIPGLILFGVVGIAEYSLHSVFADATGASAAIGIMIQVFFGIVAFVLGLLASICLGGPIATATRQYAIVFYAGRYQPLGDILSPDSQPPSLEPSGGSQ